MREFKDSYKPYGQSLHSCGYIYAITSNHGTKIGASSCPDKRIIAIMQAVPFDMELVAVFPAENMRKKEIELFDLFSNCRIKGEWFQLDIEQLKYIKSLTPENFIYKKMLINNNFDDSPF